MPEAQVKGAASYLEQQHPLKAVDLGLPGRRQGVGVGVAGVGPGLPGSLICRAGHAEGNALQGWHNGPQQQQLAPLTCLQPFGAGAGGTAPRQAWESPNQAVPLLLQVDQA